MNAVHRSGRVSTDGPKIVWTENARPQTRFSLIVEEPAQR
jgi:hypothetical protein